LVEVAVGVVEAEVETVDSPVGVGTAVAAVRAAVGDFLRDSA
jgi:hypothetical protein